MMLTGMLVPGCGLPPSLERVGELAAPPPLAAQSLASLGATPATPAAGKKRPREEEEQQLLHLVLQTTNTITQGCLYFK